MNRRTFIKSGSAVVAGLGTLLALTSKSSPSGGPPPDYLFVNPQGSFTTYNFGGSLIQPPGASAASQAAILAAANALGINQTVDIPEAGKTPPQAVYDSADYWGSQNLPTGWPGAGAPAPQVWATVIVVVIVLVIAGWIIYKLYKMATNLIPPPQTNNPPAE